MEALSLPLILLALWLVMSKKTKKSLGNFIETSAVESADHLNIASKTAKATSLADTKAELEELNVSLEDLKSFKDDLNKI